MRESEVVQGGDCLVMNRRKGLGCEGVLML